MLNTLDILIILLYFAGMIVLGLYAQRKQSSVDDYYLGEFYRKALQEWIGLLQDRRSVDGRLDRRFVGHWYLV